MKKLLSANEAAAYGAYRAGCKVAAAYPGTPSTEILENIATFKGEIACEWSPNEKVATEVAIGASMYGARAMTAMKHVGLNVALDPIMTYTFVGALGGFVVFVADDPGMHSSQNEQDSRTLVKFAKGLLLEPADSQETYDMTRAAFEISEEFGAPVFIRLTTRVSHTSTVVDLGDDFAYGAVDTKPYKRNVFKNVAVPLFARRMRAEVEERTKKLRAMACASPFNRIEDGDKSLGIIASGMAYQLAREVFPEYKMLKLGAPLPFPTDLVKQFAASVDRLLVVEELDPLLEDHVRIAGLQVVEHKTDLTMMELNLDRVRVLRSEVLGEPMPQIAPKFEGELPTRPPVLCAGCGHRGVFYLLNKLGATVAGDIGCYTLGAFPPLAAMDSTICMGASIGTAHGMEKAGKSGRIAAVLGDSTFFHSGMTGLVNVVYNQSRVTTIVLDNSITGMTGHQENPGSGKTILGEETVAMEIAEIAKAVGVRRVQIVDAYDLVKLENVLTEELDTPEPSVVIVRGPCLINAKLVNAKTYAVNENCKACGMCFKLGCPAIVRSETRPDGKFTAAIDATLCSGCALCAQVCKFNAIEKVR